MSNPEARMTFTEHLAELRTRLIWSMVAIAVGFAVSFMFSEQIFNLVARPLRPMKAAGLLADGTAGAAQETNATQEGKPADVKPADNKAESKPFAPKWTAMNPLESYVVYLKLSADVGIALALPIVIYQLCAFIFPGLTAKERKMARMLLFGCSFFVIFGVAVAYFAVFPLVLPYLMQGVPAGVEVQLRMNETVSLLVKGMLGFAAAFQFPMVVLILVYLGLLSPETLKQYRRLAIVILAVVSAILTPPDPISMTIMLVPLVVLYEMSIWMSYFVMKRKESQSKEVMNVR